VLGRILKFCTRVSGQGLGTARVGAGHVGKPVAPVRSKPRSSGSTLGSIFRNCDSVNERSNGACTPVGLAVSSLTLTCRFGAPPASGVGSSPYAVLFGNVSLFVLMK